MTCQDSELRFGPIGPNALHICVDLQRLFADDTDWKTPWMTRVLPRVERIATVHAERTIFTRFIPARRAGEGHGTWRRYYERWESMTLERLGDEMADLVPSLSFLAPPAAIFDKTVYSPWVDPRFDEMMQARHADTLVITGGETDVCVLGTVLGAVDRGYRVIVVMDALCSSSDAAHDAQMAVYQGRYGQQVETLTTDDLLRHWA